MALLHEIGAYYEGLPAPDDPSAKGAYRQADRYTSFEEAQSGSEAANGTPPVPGRRHPARERPRQSKYLSPWSELMLRRSGDWPSRRPDGKIDPPIAALLEQQEARDEVFKALKATLPETEKEELEDAEKRFHRIRCLRAIRFFSGAVNEEQTEELASKAARQQLDPLVPENRQQDAPATP